MRKSRLTKLGDLLDEIERDPAEDLDAVAEKLRAWADRLQRHARTRRRGWTRPDRGGRPRPALHLDGVGPEWTRAVVVRLAAFVRAARRPGASPDDLPSGEDLAAGYLSGGPDFPTLLRRRVAEAARGADPPRTAAASVLLWSCGDPDGPEDAERLLDRLRKGGKPRPKE